MKPVEYSSCLHLHSTEYLFCILFFEEPGQEFSEDLGSHKSRVINIHVIYLSPDLTPRRRGQSGLSLQEIQDCDRKRIKPLAKLARKQDGGYPCHVDKPSRSLPVLCWLAPSFRILQYVADRPTRTDKNSLFSLLSTFSCFGPFTRSETRRDGMGVFTYVYT